MCYSSIVFRTRLLSGVAILLGIGFRAQGADRQLQMRWTDLAPHVLTRSISTEAGGATLQGKVLAVRSDALVVEVKKTSDPGRFDGTAEIPREAGSALRVSRPGWKWRVIGTATGLLGGGIAGGAVGAHVDPHGFIISDGAAKGIGYGALGGAGLGYLAGHFADRHSTVIQIVR